MASVKVFTAAVALDEAVNEDPATITWPLLPGPAVGVMLTVTVAVWPPLMVPMLQMSWLLVGIVGQLPPVVVAETKFALTPTLLRLSTKATPEVASALFVML